MLILRKSKLIKLKRKNLGNTKLILAIDKLIADLEQSSWNSKLDLLEYRPDADRVHNEDFYFFDINVHRTLVLVEFVEDYAEIIWVGNHKEYDKLFKGNKKTIETWLRNQGKIK